MALPLDPLTILFFGVAIGFVIIFILLPRYGPHYTSRLTCPNCKKTFNFHWIPGATITSLIRRNYRDLKCPYCHRKATYDIGATRTRTAKTTKPQKTKAKA
jgi:DNA-directed RNA polymerase subunit RPC12/RpoP